MESEAVSKNFKIKNGFETSYEQHNKELLKQAINDMGGIGANVYNSGNVSEIDIGQLPEFNEKYNIESKIDIGQLPELTEEYIEGMGEGN